MDWTSPLTYGVILAVVTTVGTILWKIFWWVAKIDPLPAGFSELAKEIRGDIKQILSRLPPAPVASASPATLTDYGKKIAERFGASTWASQIAPTIIGRVANKEAFEIDEFCRDYVEKELDNTHVTLVAQVAYEFGIEHQKVRNVLRVVLRDELLNRR